MIQLMLAIWSLVPLPFLNPTWTSGSSQFMCCWSLAWRLLSITLLAYKMSAISPFAGSPGLEICSGPQNFHNSARTSLVLLFCSLWVTHPAGMSFDFMVIAPQLPSCGHFLFVFGHGISFPGGFQCPPVVGCSAAGCNFGALTGGDNHMTCYSAILNWKQTSVVFKLYCTE